jgi:hypothetical protein
MAVQPLGARPDLARKEAVGGSQQLQMVIVEQPWTAPHVEPRERQRSAFDPVRHLPRDGLEVALVRYPDMAEVALPFRPPGMRQDRLQRRPGQAPPLATHVRHQPVWHPPAEPQPPLQSHTQIEPAALGLPVKGETQREPFGIQPPLRPAHIPGRDAFDEVHAGPIIKEGAQLVQRAQGQAGTGQKGHMGQTRICGQQRSRRVLCRGDQTPAAPGRIPPFGKGRPCHPVQRTCQPGVFHIRGLRIHMHDHRASRLRQMPHHLRRPVEASMRKDHEPDCHSQSPWDIRPRSTSCCQPTKGSDHSWCKTTPHSASDR